MKFNPKEKRGGGGSSDALQAGEYGLALVAFQRKVSKAGTDYLKLKCEVTDGPRKGETTWLMISCDLTKRGTAVRWSFWSESVGVTDEFEVGSTNDGTAHEGDEAIRSLFVGKPFRAKIKAERSDKYVNNDIETFVAARLWSPGQREAMAAWAVAWEARKQAKRDDYGPPPDDSPADAPIAGHDEWHGDDAPPAFSDDDFGF